MEVVFAVGDGEGGGVDCGGKDKGGGGIKVYLVVKIEFMEG